MIKIQIITIFPEMFKGVLDSSMLWKAQKQGAVEFSLIDLRQFGLGKRRTLDDKPYGGGDGMLLRVEPIFAAVEFAKQQDKDALVILPTPRGGIFKQSIAKQLVSQTKGLIIICPRYEGYDERIVNLVDKQICIGKYILTGGEIPAMIILDSVVRLLPGVLGGETSKEIESFQNDDKTIEFPQYTRPENFRDLKVPDVLLNGNHQQIQQWRKKHEKLS
jgi:tRNA (guanine37-N1)-methyltransferase